MVLLAHELEQLLIKIKNQNHLIIFLDSKTFMNIVTFKRRALHYDIYKRNFDNDEALEAFVRVFNDGGIPLGIVKDILIDPEVRRYDGNIFSLCVYDDKVMIEMGLMLLNGSRQIENYKIEMLKADLVKFLNVWIELEKMNAIITLGREGNEMFIEGEGNKFSAPWKRIQYDYEGTDEDEVIDF